MKRHHVVTTVLENQPKVQTPIDHSSVDWWEGNWASSVFTEEMLAKRVPRSIFKSYQTAVKTHTPLNQETANVVASAMKDWAVERGATHYTHWFQPLHVMTAEKHESFISFQGDSKTILKFDGSELIRGEGDASSFPNGGIRTTFRARGYTIWDPTSPAFIRVGRNGSTLMIPSMFCSWTGDALDVKTPLLRSCDALSKQAVKLLKLLGDTKVEYVNSTMGAEQEFFMIDRTLYAQRADLVFTGRTVMGARPPKGQEMEDHYFGTIPPRILACVQEIENELWKLGVPTKSRHNEVAPAQHEMAPIFELSNVAADHNMLMMEVMREVSNRHGLQALLHEKPFSGINGSGKHNNWSMSTDYGKNLLEPGAQPTENLTFLVFLAIAIRAVDVHGDLLRASVANPGNDWRLGANEAPPAIMSVYLGAEIEHIVDEILAEHEASVTGTKRAPVAAVAPGSHISLGAGVAPFRRDATDRNRTSPFAFTGNKFEFRAVGSSQSVGQTCTVLNSIAADSIRDFTAQVEARITRGETPQVAARKVIGETLFKHKRIIFNGNGYSEDWVKEAEKRKLPNFRECVVALEQYKTAKNVELFKSLNILSEQELHARIHVHFHHYCSTIRIEGDVSLQLAATAVLPAATKHLKEAGAAIIALKKAGLPEASFANQLASLKETNQIVEELVAAIAKLKAALAEEKSIGFTNANANAAFMRDSVRPAIATVREKCDALETVVEDELWPMPKYSDMLFLK